MAGRGAGAEAHRQPGALPAAQTSSICKSCSLGMGFEPECRESVTAVQGTPASPRALIAVPGVVKLHSEDARTQQGIRTEGGEVGGGRQGYPRGYCSAHCCGDYLAPAVN